MPTYGACELHIALAFIKFHLPFALPFVRRDRPSVALGSLRQSSGELMILVIRHCRLQRVSYESLCCYGCR